MAYESQNAAIAQAQAKVNELKASLKVIDAYEAYKRAEKVCDDTKYEISNPTPWLEAFDAQRKANAAFCVALRAFHRITDYPIVSPISNKEMRISVKETAYELALAYNAVADRDFRVEA